ncbi:class I SAM-dependent methyltransferase [Alphaproteobacteria bacterium]|nr:class I SAM-dependent methyltransferase [Alphaproteobacteria bacterium]MDC1157099.1 class I SAM-dependent methyltransferase [Alphaproteobacteria bacterium]
MSTKNNVSKYFSDNAGAWLADAYEQSGYNYPTPFHRLRVLKKIIVELEGVRKVLDIGCGGGQVAISLAGLGYQVIGVDESENMISSALNSLENQDEQIKQNLRFVKQSIYDFDMMNFDALTAMGVIGYFPSDKTLFDIAFKRLTKNGYFIASFRNKLFDLCSISNYTIRDIKDGDIERLIGEFKAIASEPISQETVEEFVGALHLITGKILENGFDQSLSSERPSKQQHMEYVGNCDPRQSTPAEVKSIASAAGFETISINGVHPHFLNPYLNRLLPATVYNQLSDALIPLESSSVALTWSSVFIGVFKKNDN